MVEVVCVGGGGGERENIQRHSILLSFFYGPGRDFFSENHFFINLKKTDLGVKGVMITKIRQKVSTHSNVFVYILHSLLHTWFSIPT